MVLNHTGIHGNSLIQGAEGLIQVSPCPGGTTQQILGTGGAEVSVGESEQNIGD